MTLRLGLVGHPVKHSLSPKMHGAWIAAAGLDATYEAYEVDPATPGGDLLAKITALGLSGVNLTVPFKERVLPLLDGLDPVARRTGAVNTVVLGDGALWGSNTDVPGFMMSVREAGARLDGATALILGAGGAARAVAFGLAEGGVAEILLLNRTVERAREVALHLNRSCPQVEFSGESLSRFPELSRRASVFAMTVSRPGLPAVRALDTRGVRADALWIDLNYWDPKPPRFAALREQGVRTVGGLSMLIHQGALAFTAFTGAPADPQVAWDVLSGGNRA